MIRTDYGDMFDPDAPYHTQMTFEVAVSIDPDEIFKRDLSQSQYVTIPVVGEYCSAK